MTFHKHEYFSSEDLDLNNSPKFSLNFLHYSAIYYAFYKISTQNRSWNLAGNRNLRVPKQAVPVLGAKTGDNQAKAMAGAWRATLAGGEAGRWCGGAAERPAQAGRAAARGGIA